MKHLKQYEDFKQHGINYTSTSTSTSNINKKETTSNNVDVSDRGLRSLEILNLPDTIDGDFNCSKNKLINLEFCPEIINGDFNCSKNQLTSLEFCPKTVHGVFYCSNNNWTNPIPWKIIEKFNITIDNIYTDEQIKKFSSYGFQNDFITNTPEKYKDLEIIGYDTRIKVKFDWLFSDDYRIGNSLMHSDILKDWLDVDEED